MKEYVLHKPSIDLQQKESCFNLLKNLSQPSLFLVMEYHFFKHFCVFPACESSVSYPGTLSLIIPFFFQSLQVVSESTQHQQDIM